MADTLHDPRTFEEWLKELLVPPGLYIRYKAAKERWKGEPEIRLLPFLVDPRRNAIDAGANKGTYTYVLARLARHVYAFEPNPKMLRVLQRTASSNVTVSGVALSDTGGSAELRLPRYGKGTFSHQGASLSPVKVTEDYGSLTVRTARIDDLACGEVGFLKVDVEGHEMAVIAGARAVIARDRPTLLVEIEEKHTKVPIEHSLASILDLGYAGLFLDRQAGALTSLDRFDGDHHHRHPDRGYVFNFVFLPKH